MTKYRDLTTAEAAAIEAFATAHGRRWKDELGNVYWYNARIWSGPEPGMGSLLHGLRNDLGPTWLWDVYRLPKAPTARRDFPIGAAVCVDDRAAIVRKVDGHGVHVEFCDAPEIGTWAHHPNDVMPSKTAPREPLRIAIDVFACAAPTIRLAAESERARIAAQAVIDAASPEQLADMNAAMDAESTMEAAPASAGQYQTLDAIWDAAEAAARDAAGSRALFNVFMTFAVATVETAESVAAYAWPISVKQDGHEVVRCTLREFLADNELSSLEVARLRATLGRGEAFSGGGGAAPCWSVRRIMQKAS